jgi:hypothetical protein
MMKWTSHKQRWRFTHGWRIWNQWSSIATMVYKCNVLRIFPCRSLMRGLIGLSGSPSVNMFMTFSVWDINFLEEQGADED